MSDAYPLEHSRSLLLAARASASASDNRHLRSHMEATMILLSAEADLPGAIQSLSVLAATLRRGPGRLFLDPTTLDPGDIERVVGAIMAIDPKRGIAVTASPPEPDVHVHLGTRPSGRAIRAVPHRHGGHLLLDPAIAGPTVTDVSGLGIVFTASIAAAEVFKTLAAVVPARRRSPGQISFCPVTLGSDPGAAPILSSHDIDLALVGIGAIGTAVVLILSLLPLSGRLLAVDPQRFDRENLGTYSLGTLADTVSRPQKTALAERALTGWTVCPFGYPVADLPAAVDDGRVHWPTTVIVALDDVAPRHAAQLLWSDVLIDAGTGDTSVGMHELRPVGPCEQCAFPIRKDGPSSIDRLAAATGLDPSYLAVDGVLDVETVDQLPADQQEQIRPLVGTRRCSLAQALGLSELDPDKYQPAIPFVAQQAACLAVGRLVALLTSVATTVTQFQYDVLRGPDLAHADRLAARPSCYCQQQADRIEQIRRLRGAAALGR
ncbi:MAG: hypothetical protein M3083_00695 [Actinomycetota bacterium]|nr:hypothetical protein [Actinomycetota bacterium]MDQ6945078.1 hypothetical protein [Actinomycetota bacterium]